MTCHNVPIRRTKMLRPNRCSHPGATASPSFCLDAYFLCGGPTSLTCVNVWTVHTGDTTNLLASPAPNTTPMVEPSATHVAKIQCLQDQVLSLNDAEGNGESKVKTSLRQQINFVMASSSSQGFLKLILKFFTTRSSDKLSRAVAPWAIGFSSVLPILAPLSLTAGIKQSLACSGAQ